MPRTLRSFLFAVLALWLGGCSRSSEATLRPPLQFPQTWQNVAIGGGGYVTGLHIHPQVPELVYIRTDNGGFYRRTGHRWLAITDHFTRDQQNYYGGEALGLDPNNPNVVLIAAGQYSSEGPGTVFRSQDQGQSWQASDLRVGMRSDEDKRWAGHRLVVSPHDSNLVLFGSRADGLWRSQDGGLTWKPVRSLQTQADPDVGLLALTFDPQVQGRVVLGAYGDGIYESGDSGLTWTRLKGSPSHPMKLAIASDSTLYVTSDRAPGVSQSRQNRWSDITPKGYRDRVFNGLSVHPRDPNWIVVSVGERGSAELFYSRDQGQTWQQPQHQVHHTVPWWPDSFFRDHTAAVQLNPSRPQEVWLTDWFGIWKTSNLLAHPARWENQQQGHEQVVVFSLLAPPQGPLLLSGVADVNGFAHPRLDHFPSQRLGPQGWPPQLYSVDGDTYDFAYSAHHPLEIVRVGGKRWNQSFGIYRSADGGQSWSTVPNFPSQGLPLRVAMSADNPERMIVVLSQGNALLTGNGGASWQQVQGLPVGPEGPWTWTQPLAADGDRGDRFYYFAAGTLYRSEDGGASFAPIQQNLPETDPAALHTLAGQPDQLWLSLGDAGLYRSNDGGQTLDQVQSVAEAALFTIGPGPEGSSFPLWYLYGTLATGETGIFYSNDQGQTWTNISEPKTPIGARPRTMEASPQQIGLIFIGTNGRGIYYKQVRP
ncbi:hypothetical protein [Lyngbya confervoides]|uniref:Sortilin N-terminal domain-containing protein n=1 Tax=Lyngbya confervoides BDU141951 TaxID=1574623 RepID=A0ABD4T7G6_9CYAN|nr:hypothetical protein [Lyngbya confervoides]MCM1984696.1 hypothetical protein [Lyngbya confervoides BDU141951]